MHACLFCESLTVISFVCLVPLIFYLVFLVEICCLACVYVLTFLQTAGEKGLKGDKGDTGNCILLFIFEFLRSACMAFSFDNFFHLTLSLFSTAGYHIAEDILFMCAGDKGDKGDRGAKGEQGEQGT